ncbi:FEKKY domain-containing protein [Sphingobacterium pedocola]|uniref:Uncharacterized protein n=1 Tax=Sphingobacterium pedocola TaxID=2082722 RepID=A0ABR9T7B0_9SPHI|nr:hypothetical protein [Sphingobacterium pedocola]MBE8721221.1 hypothetical protein [Sphingobacterium pedocola]
MKNNSADKNNIQRKKTRLGLLLAIIAIIWTLLIILLDLSNLGQWDYISINLKRIRLEDNVIFLKLIAAGCIIGLIPFAKRKYKARIALSIPMAFIVFCLYRSVIMIDFYYGWSDGCNYFTAKRDIEKGKIQILYAGQLYYESDEVYDALDSLTKSYGYTLINVGIFFPGAERYNEVMYDYLKRKNGPDWQDVYGRKADSIRSTAKP